MVVQAVCPSVPPFLKRSFSLQTLLLLFDLDFYFFVDSAVLFPIQSIELLRTRCRSVLNRPSREEIPNGYELSAGNCTRSQSTLRVVL